MARTIVPCFCLKMKMYDFPIVLDKGMNIKMAFPVGIEPTTKS